MIATDTPAATGRSLQPHHYRELQASGLSDDTIREAGIYSETRSDALAALLNWRKCTLGPAIVFPFVDADGRNGYSRIKPDFPRKDTKDKVTKYESPKGQPNRIYLPPGVAGVLQNIEADLIVTEGEKKALKANQDGFRTIGLVGVHGWKEKDHDRLLPELERVAWNGRKVFIAFDSDIDVKPQVLQAECKLAKHLQNRRAVVKCVRIPDGPPDEAGKPTKQGVDDYLVNYGPGEFKKLLENASEPEDCGLVGKLPAKFADPATEAEAYLETGRLDDVYRLRFWRGGFYLWQQGRYVEIPVAEVKAYLVRHLNTDYSMLTTSIVANVLQQVQSAALLPGHHEPACWIDDVEQPVDWPADEILVARNGLVHLPSLIEGKASSHPLTPRLFNLNALDYDHDPDAPPPFAWLRFLDDLWHGDGQSIETLQEWFGYSLMSDTSQQKILMLIGPKRSGKGTICRIQRALVGPANCAGPTLASFGQNFGLWPLLGKSLAIISDARLSGRIDQSIIIERLLSISGEDALTVDRKNLQPVTAKLGARIMLVSNELPRLADSSGALTGRMILLQLNQSFYGREDPALTDTLLAELPGILGWAIEGWRRLRDRGRFVQPASAADLFEDMQDLASPIGEFVKAACVVGQDHSVSRPSLYETYKSWAESKGRKSIEDEAGFGRALHATCAGLTTTQHRMGASRVRMYRGIGLKPPFES